MLYEIRKFIISILAKTFSPINLADSGIMDIVREHSFSSNQYNLMSTETDGSDLRD